MTHDIPKTVSASGIRRKGLLRFVLSAAVFALGVGYVLFIGPHSHEEWDMGDLLIFAVPGGYALVGLIEMITGVPFSNLARKWDDLKGWQRGVLGTLIVIFASGLILGAVGLFFSRQ